MMVLGEAAATLALSGSERERLRLRSSCCYRRTAIASVRSHLAAALALLGSTEGVVDAGLLGAGGLDAVRNKNKECPRTLSLKKTLASENILHGTAAIHTVSNQAVTQRVLGKQRLPSLRCQS